MRYVINVLRKVFIAFAILLLGLSLILPGLSLETEVVGTAAIALKFFNYVAISGVQLGTYLLCLFVGVILIFVKKTLLVSVGYALIGVSVVLSLVGITSSLDLYNAAEEASLGFGTIAALVGVILYVVSLVLYFTESVFFTTPTLRGLDARIDEFKKWKSLLDEGIITEAEYEEKRVELLGINKEDKLLNAKKK